MNKYHQGQAFESKKTKLRNTVLTIISNYFYMDRDI